MTNKTFSTVSTGYRNTKRSETMARLEGRTKSRLSRPVVQKSNFMSLDEEDEDEDEDCMDNDADDESSSDSELDGETGSIDTVDADLRLSYIHLDPVSGEEVKSSKSEYFASLPSMSIAWDGISERDEWGFVESPVIPHSPADSIAAESRYTFSSPPRTPVNGPWTAPAEGSFPFSNLPSSRKQHSFFDHDSSLSSARSSPRSKRRTDWLGLKSFMDLKDSSGPRGREGWRSFIEISTS
jgi:hypothetical protein